MTDQPENPSNERELLEGIEPELLREVGRASAVQDLKELARQLAVSSENFQLAMLQGQEAQTAFWRRIARALAGGAAVLALGLIIAVGLAFWNMDTAADTNQIVRSLRDQQVDIDELQVDLAEVRDFVRQVQAERDDGPNPAIANALSAIARIEQRLCGGTCAG